MGPWRPGSGEPASNASTPARLGSRWKTKRGRFNCFWGATFERPLGSRLAGTLELEDGPDALSFRVARLPETSYVADFRAQQAAGSAVFGVRPLFRIPPADVVPGAVDLIPEPEAAGGALVEVIREAVLTALAVVTRAPRGNPGELAGRVRRRRRWL